MKNILFYAVQEDLQALLETVDVQGQLKYTPMGNFLKSDVEDGISIFNAGADIPNLGTATADSSAACESFLVSEGSVNLRQAGKNGERVCVDQLINPDSVEFKPGGLWNENVVIQGRIATASQSQISQALMKRFQVAVKRVFSKVGSYYVGTRAFALLREGKRLTVAVQSPPECDLDLRN
jgi:hypothetical protein